MQKSALALLAPVLVLLLGAGGSVVPVRADDEAPQTAEGLRVRARVDPSSLGAGDRVTFTATFENVGDTPRSFFVPLHPDLDGFPRWELVGASGTVLVPGAATYQSMWKEGLQGEIVELEPGASRSWSFSRSAFLVTGGPHDAVEAPLAPGRYLVRATYVQADDTVPFSETAFRTTRRHEPGLWSGRLRSAPAVLEVLPSGRPDLAVESPARVEAGAPLPVRVVLRNPGPEAFRATGFFEVAVHSKPWGSAALRALPRGRALEAAPPGATGEVRIAPGERLVLETDLAAQTFHGRRGGVECAEGLYDVVRSDGFALSVALVVGGERRLVATRTVTVAERDPAALGGLSLRVEPSPAAAVSSPTVVVILENTGPGPVSVPASLSYPRHVFLSIRPVGGGATSYAVTMAAPSTADGLVLPEEPGMRAQVPEGLAWDAAAFEDAGSLDRATTVVLAPGASLRRRLVLSDLLSGGDLGTAGTLEVRAYWRNLENGSRLGLPTPLAVGLIGSDPVAVPGSTR